MSLQFDLFGREDREFTIPIVLQDHIIHDFLSVQHDRHTVTYHLDIKAVPFTQLIIRHFRRLAFVHLVVV